MKKLDVKLNNLIDKIVILSPGYNNHITYSKYIELLEQTLDVYNYIQKKRSNDLITDYDYYIIGTIIKDLLKHKLTNASRIDIKNKLESLYHQLEEALVNIPKIESQEVKITDINSLIKSLKIYKLSGTKLSQVTYHSSYQLYSDLRKIIFNRNSNLTTRVYAGRIANKLSSITCIDIKQEDYELFCSMRLIKENPDFGYGFPIPANRQQQIDILTRFDRNERVNNLLELKKVVKD